MKRVAFLLAPILFLAGCAREAGRGPLGSPTTGTAPTPPASCSEPGPKVAVLCLVAREQAPEAVLFVGTERVEGVAGSSCWTRVTGGEGVASCVDTVWPPEIERYIQIERGAEILLVGDAAEVDVSLAELGSGDRLRRVGLKDGRARLTIGPGRYLLDVFATWPQGDASFGFGVKVVQPGLES